MKTKSSLLSYLSSVLVPSFACFRGVLSILPDRNLLIPTYGKFRLRFMGSSREDGSPQCTSPAHCQSFLKVPEIRRHVLYCETFIAQGGHRCYVKSTVCNSFFQAFVFSQSSHHINSAVPQQDSRDIWCLFLSAFDPGSFFIPLLQPAAQSYFFVTSRPGHCKHT